MFYLIKVCYLCSGFNKKYISLQNCALNICYALHRVNDNKSDNGGGGGGGSIVVIYNEIVTVGLLDILELDSK